MPGNEKYIDYRKAYLIIYAIKTKTNLSSIEGLSFNIILDGLYGDYVLRDAMSIETIPCKNGKFYITRVPIKEDEDLFYLPSSISSSQYNSIISDYIEIIDTDDKIYLHYWFKNINLESIEKYYCANIKYQNFFYAIASFYCNITHYGFSMQENQFLKAILFKVLFHSKSSRSLDDKTVDITNKVIQLLIDTFENQTNSLLIELHINNISDNLIDAYFIHNVFVRAYNDLDSDSKYIIDELFNITVEKIKSDELL